MSEPIFTQVERSVAELSPNAINPRTLKDKAFKELQQSLKKDPHFLKARPIIVSMEEGREGTVIAGNQRLAAAKALGWATVPVVEVRGATEEQEKEWMVKDNLHKGEWDFDKLAEGFDLDFLKDMGFDEKELNKVLANVDNSADDEFDAEKEAEAITEPIVKRGDIWQLGEHRLMCGDSTDAGDVALLMDGKKADMVFTDPPYGINYAGKGIVGSAKANDFGEIIGDGSVAVAKSAYSLAKELAPTLIFWGANYYPSVFDDGFGWLVWDKEKEGDLFSGAEIAFVNAGVKVNVFRHAWHGMIKASERGQKRVHPTQKPTALAEWCFEQYGRPSVVLDLFLGSGSTLIACENTKRICYGMEIDPKYCDVIIKRWEEKTGKKAVKTQV